jgi:hypothetical protein
MTWMRGKVLIHHRDIHLITRMQQHRTQEEGPACGNKMSALISVVSGSFLAVTVFNPPLKKHVSLGERLDWNHIVNELLRISSSVTS